MSLGEIRTERVAVGFANYNGDVDISARQAMGPNYMGEYMWPVSATYSPEDNKTKVGFSLQPPPPLEIDFG